MASRTLLFFFLEASKILGESHFGKNPWSQLEDQKVAVSPSPIVNLVAALNISLSEPSFGVSRPTHCFSGAAYSSHSQRNRRARANFSRSRIPSPPKALGRQTFVQQTLHFPPLTVSLPAHNILRRNLSKAFRVALSVLMAVRRKIGIAVSTDLTRASQPALLRNLAFQGFNLDAALSM